MEHQQRYSVDIEVEPAYLEEQSVPRRDRYVFSYAITLRNSGTIAVQLLRRHWIITDANGHEREVRGEGVVGEQPYLRPGEDFRYTSGAIIETPVGTMRGSYQMLADDGALFDASVDPFTLAIPRTLH